MATITLKNVPKSLHARLTRRAKSHKRSLNQEAIACLEETLQMTAPMPTDVLLERFAKLRESIKVPPLTEEFLEWSKNDGRA